MKKLTRKLSVFALSSVILLANSPIKAGMFAEGQTYDLGEVGTVNIRNHDINNDGSLEAFDVHIKDLELDIDVYRKNDGIAYVLRKTGNVVSSDTIEHCEDFRNAEYVLKILIEQITEKSLPTFPRLIPSTPEGSMTTIEASVMDETQKTPKHRNQESKTYNKHVAEKKPTKVNQPKYRKITYTLPTCSEYDFTHGHCTCNHPSPAPKRDSRKARIDEKRVSLTFRPCLQCKRPIRQSREGNQSCCWKTYCKKCNHETEFYMTRDEKNECTLRCYHVFPFEIHEIEYDNKDKFNADVDRGHIKFICSKDPTHARAHIYKGSGLGPRCLDCLTINYAKKSKK